MNDDWRPAEFDRRRKGIGANCACRRERAQDCHYERYGIPSVDLYDEGCTCLCHIELIALHQELWPSDTE